MLYRKFNVIFVNNESFQHMCILGSYVTVTCSGVYQIHEVGIAQGFIINNAMYAMQHTLTKRYAKSNAMQNT